MNVGGLSMIFPWKGTVVGTYGLLIWKNLIFSRVLAISQGELGLTGKMGGRKSFFFCLVWCFFFNFSSLGSDTHCFTLLFEILPLKNLGKKGTFFPIAKLVLLEIPCWASEEK